VSRIETPIIGSSLVHDTEATSVVALDATNTILTSDGTSGKKHNSFVVLATHLLLLMVRLL
jgi:hypothetical protein